MRPGSRTRNGKRRRITGWNTQADGQGKAYAAGADYTLTAGDDVLYAQWSANNNTEYKVEHYTVDSKGEATLYGDPVVKTGTTDTKATAEPITIPGYTYAEGYENGEDVEVKTGTITGDGKLVLKLYYTANADELVYNANTGTGEMDPTEGYVDEAVKVAANGFSKPGYAFTGWNTQADGQGKAYAAGADYTLTAGDDVLYAQWEQDFSEFEEGIAAAGQSWTYDASERTLNITGVYPGDELTYEFGDETVKVTVNADGQIEGAPTFKNVADTASVKVTVTRGGESATGTADMTINPAEITVTTPSASKVFDGTPLKAAGTMSGLVNGETATFTTTGSVTNVDDANNGVAHNNTYTIEWNGTALEGNYAITENLGR